MRMIQKLPKPALFAPIALCVFIFLIAAPSSRAAGVGHQPPARRTGQLDELPLAVAPPSDPKPLPKPPDQPKPDANPPPDKPADQQLAAAQAPSAPAAQKKKRKSDIEDWNYDDEMKNEGAFRGSGNCKCATMTGLDSAIRETIEYFKKNQACIEAGTPASQYMAINDYQHRTGCMYILDHDGNCQEALDSAYGTGSATSDAPNPGCGNGSLMSPSGFHVTANHDGARYDHTNSLLMQDLQGQESADRNILIHQGSCAGGACTWGCSGVSNFPLAQKMLSPGSLVYNYFGENKSCPGINPNTCIHPTSNRFPHGRGSQRANTGNSQ